MFARLAVLALLSAALLASKAAAVPEADHILIECDVLRLTINDYTVRHQVKVIATVSSSDEASLASVPMSLMRITNHLGTTATIGCYSQLHTPKRFKAANTRVLFRAVGDSAGSEDANVPDDFFDGPGPYLVELMIRDAVLSGEVSFGVPLTMEVRQQGRPVSNFVLGDEAPMDVYTAPAEFGPVYYKQQDMSNFMFQLANIENALETGDFHTPVESPRYLFQVKVGDGVGGPVRLLDPQRYIEGYKPHMIRSEKTTTPLHFGADEFDAGEVLVVDFRREETLEPDTVFGGLELGLSSNTTVTERVMYALAVETAPTPAELGIVADEPGE